MSTIFLVFLSFLYVFVQGAKECPDRTMFCIGSCSQGCNDERCKPIVKDCVRICIICPDGKTHCFDLGRALRAAIGCLDGGEWRKPKENKQTCLMRANSCNRNDWGP